VRYDKVGAHLHCSVFKALGIETTDKWHKHARTKQYVNVKMLQCYGIKGHTDKEVTANRPNIIQKNKREKTCIMIDVAIAAERNITQKE
jgi:hypothetical protein